MPIEYVLISENCLQYLPLPTQDDGSLTLKTLSESFPGCCGLTYVHPKTSTVRGLRVKDGCLYPPNEGWNSFKYTCNFPKETLDRPFSKMYPKEATDLIVLGLPWGSTEDTIREYFETFGKVKKVWLKKNSQGQSKGFAFIRFATYYTQMRVLTKSHFIDGRKCDVLIPHSKKGVPFKVFVGGCTEDLTLSTLQTYFSQYGQVIDIFIPKPFRPFAFVTFLDSGAAKDICHDNHKLNGVTLSVSVAVPKMNHCNFRYVKNNQVQNTGEKEYCNPLSTHFQWNNNSCNIDTLTMQGLHIGKPETYQNCSNSSFNPFSLAINPTSALFNHNWGVSQTSTWNEIDTFRMPNIHEQNLADLNHGSENIFPWFSNSYQRASTDFHQLFPAPVYQDSAL